MILQCVLVGLFVGVFSVAPEGALAIAIQIQRHTRDANVGRT